MRLILLVKCAIGVGATCALVGCGSDATPAPAADTAAAKDSATGADGTADSAADSAGPTAETAGGTETSPGETAGEVAGKDAEAPLDITVAPNGLLENGDWLLGVQALPFGNLKLPLKVSLAAEGDLAKGGKIIAFQIRSMSTDLTFTSEPVVTLKDIAVAPGGAFEIKAPNYILPGKASPTGSDVPLNLILKGKITSKEAFCGDVEGDVPQFGPMPLAGSKFKAVPFGKQTTPFESSCEGNVSKIFAPIANCPEMLAGETTVTSGERSRSFLVQLPKLTRKAQLPLVVLFHGVGGEPDKMIGESGLTVEQGKAEPFILIAPRSERVASTGKALLKLDWYYGSSLFDTDNPDLIFFDDIVKCAAEKLKIDTKRIYVTGMSGGGLMSSFVGIHRPKVVAAAAPFSGGYLHPWPKDSGKVPFVFSWGGPTDTAFEQPFDEMAKKINKNLKDTTHFVIACDHGLGHKWPKEGGAYAAKFLLAHTLGGDSPFAKGLDASWPSYCKIF